jgi:hypothetical protein
VQFRHEHFLVVGLPVKMPMIGGHHRLAVCSPMDKPSVPYIPIHKDRFDFADVLPRGGSQQLVRNLPDSFLGSEAVPIFHGWRPIGDQPIYPPDQGGWRVAQNI